MRALPHAFVDGGEGAESAEEKRWPQPTTLEETIKANREATK